MPLIDIPAYISYPLTLIGVVIFSYVVLTQHAKIVRLSDELDSTRILHKMDLLMLGRNQGEFKKAYTQQRLREFYPEVDLTLLDD